MDDAKDWNIAAGDYLAIEIDKQQITYQYRLSVIWQKAVSVIQWAGEYHSSINARVSSQSRCTSDDAGRYGRRYDE